MLKILHDYVTNSHIVSKKYLLQTRLWFYCLVYCFMVVIGFILLRIDFTTAEDPLVRLYQHNRWLLITSWFNLISLVYTPICIYCDWRELRGTGAAKHVAILNKIRFVCFTSILFPATCCSDLLFWRLWMKNRELVAPKAVDMLVPLWLQHCLHTITFIIVILDLLLVPKRRPRNLTFGAIVLTVFLAAFGVACCRSIMINEHIYPLLKLFSGYNYIILIMFGIVETLFYFTLQWLINDLVWGRRTHTKTEASKDKFTITLKKNANGINKIKT